MSAAAPTQVEATQFLTSFAAALRKTLNKRQLQEEAEKNKQPEKPAARKLTPNPVASTSPAHFPPLAPSVPSKSHELLLPHRLTKPSTTTHPPSHPAPTQPQPERKHSQQQAQDKSEAPKPKPVDPDAVDRSAIYHQLCAYAAPLQVCGTLLDLLQSARVTVPVKGDEILGWKPPSPVRESVNSWQGLRLYGQLTLPKLCDFLYAYPAPIATACASSTFSLPLPAAEERSFPLIDGEPPWTVPLPYNLPSPTVLRDERGLDLPNKLSLNLERAWDQVLWLHRQYVGEVSNCPPGVLHVKTALFTMAALHPANMDVFAFRFVNLMSHSALQARDATPKMRQLSARLRSTGSTAVTEDRARNMKKMSRPRPKGGSEEGVVLHRLPELVRKTFGDDPAELFFLDFVTAVDSAKLYIALIPRLSAALAESIDIATSATSNVSFTDAILDARMYAKFLCVAMNANNWSHSPHSLSGTLEVKSNKRPGLGITSLKWRSPIHAATWVAVFDVETRLASAVKSGQLLAITAMVAIAAVIIRLASLDPIAASSEWYMRCLHALRDLRVESNNPKGNPDNRAVSMPLLSAIIGEVLNSNECADHVSNLPPQQSSYWQAFANDKHDWRAVGDIRFIRECCPQLDELRKTLVWPMEGSNRAQKVTARRITPLAKARAGIESSPVKLNGKLPETEQASRHLDHQTPVPGTAAKQEKNEGDENEGNSGIQGELRREFYTRMDGRLRELIGVVVSSKPKSHDSALQKYTDVAKVLYPSIPQTIIAVAGYICAEKVVEGLQAQQAVMKDKYQPNLEDGKDRCSKDEPSEQNREVSTASVGTSQTTQLEEELSQHSKKFTSRSKPD